MSIKVVPGQFSPILFDATQLFQDFSNRGRLVEVNHESNEPKQKIWYTLVMSMHNFQLFPLDETRKGWQFWESVQHSIEEPFQSLTANDKLNIQLATKHIDLPKHCTYSSRLDGTAKHLWSIHMPLASGFQ